MGAEQGRVAAAMAAVGEHRDRLRALLEGHEPAVVAARPPSGDWSAIENMRHLLFTEQMKLGRLVPGGLGVSPMGLPQGGRVGAIAGTNPTTDVAAVFDEWARIHAAACDGLDLARPSVVGQLLSSVPGERGGLLPRILSHQELHGRAAARALSQVTGQVVRVPRAPRSAAV